MHVKEVKGKGKNWSDIEELSEIEKKKKEKTKKEMADVSKWGGSLLTKNEEYLLWE